LKADIIFSTAKFTTLGQIQQETGPVHMVAGN